MITAETSAFDAVLDFWRLPHDGGPEAVRLVDAEGFDDCLEHAVVHVRGGDRPRLWRFMPDGGYVFASITPVVEPPGPLGVVARLEEVGGPGVSFVLEDATRHVVFVPFSPDEAVRAFQREEYVPPAAASRGTALKIYYAVKRVVPRAVLMAARSFVARRQMRSLSFPQWPLETSLDDLQRLILTLLLRAARSDSLPFVWFWPSGSRAAVTLTHDVEGADGLAAVPRFIEAEREEGLVSSFNLVPSKYEIREDALRRIVDSGCEVGVHGWDHRGSLVEDRVTFIDRVARINSVGERWGAAGFRSPSTYRDPDWFADLRFDYDSSFPDTDPYEPQPGGCLSLFPFMMGELVELPITMPQDHTQFVLLRRDDADIWRAKSEALAARHGLVCVLAHPDTAEGYSGSDRVFPLYREMLARFAADDTLWRALPRDVAKWWRARSATSVRPDGAGLVGPAAGDAWLGRASLRDGELVLDRVAPVRVGGEGL